MLKWLVVALVVWAVWKLLSKPRKPRAMARVAPPSPQENAALDLLGIGMHSDAQAVRDAYRTRIAATHPDRGGSAERTQQLNAARDLLLRTRGD